ncbi:MAG: hypothetical protein IRY99_11810, partial [Isosphaeraceae bacterium]|nr:hypothetical protein [Isosphaeraceae bacterium]
MVARCRSRHAWLALLALAAAGCRAGVGGFARPVAPPINRNALTAQEVVEQINRNARAVHSLQVLSDVRVRATSLKAPVRGMIAMRRPRDFRLQMRTTMGNSDIADLGSNDRSFWFWMADNKERTVFVGEYDENGNPPPDVPLTFQPDWIVEAMGLRIIPESEIPAITVRRGPQRELILTQKRQSGNGQPYVKYWIVDEATKLVREHQLWSADQRYMLALAKIDSPYQAVQVPAADGEGKVSVLFPRSMRLKFVREDFELWVSFGQPTINLAFEGELADLFTEPPFEGYARVPLGSGRLPGRSMAGPTRSYQTKPPPASDSEPTAGPTDEVSPARLGDPIPIGTDGASLRWSDPMPLEADLPGPEPGPSGSRAESVLGARIPR